MQPDVQRLPPHTPEAEHQVLRRLFDGVQHEDERAFRELHERLSRPLMAYCLSFTGDMDIAKDLFQSTMVAIYEYRHRYRDGNLLGWLFTIARNTCRTWQTRSKRFVPLEVETMVAPQHEYLDDDEIAYVQKAIMSLDDDYRQVVLLRYFGDMSMADIAEAEGLSESLVRVRLFRARARLATILKDIIGPES